MATVDILLRTPGGPAAAGPTGGAPPGKGGMGGAAKDEKKGGGKDPAAEASKKGLAKVGSHLKGAKKFFSKNLGLQFGMSSILKQSQVFTSFIGVIFQLVGALVDVILAPLLPLFFPVIRMIGSWIPHFQKWSESAYAWIITGFNTLLGWYRTAKAWMETKIAEFQAAWAAGPKEFAIAIMTLVWNGLTWVWNKIINTAFPWLWDQIKGLGDGIWSFLQTTGGRIFGWFVQGYVMFIKFRAIVSGIARWGIGFGDSIIRFIGAKALQFLVWGLKLIPRLIGLAWKVASFLIKMILPGFGHIIVAIVNATGRLVGKIPQVLGWVAKSFRGWIDDILLRLMLFRDSLMKWLRGALNLVPTAIKDFVTRLMSSLKRFFADTVKNLLTRLGTLLGNIPYIGGTLKKIGGLGKGLFGAVKGIGGTVAGKIGGKGLLTGVKSLAKMSKAIPVLGAVATAGFGAVETVKMYKSHGMAAAFATAGKTIAATTATAMGQSMLGLSIDLGGTVAINALMKKKALESANQGTATQAIAGMAATGGAAVVVNIQTANGETLFEQMIDSQTDSEDFSFELSNELQASGQV